MTEIFDQAGPLAAPPHFWPSKESTTPTTTLLHLINAVFDFNVEKGLDVVRSNVSGAVASTSVVRFGNGYRIAAARRLLNFRSVLDSGQDVAQGRRDGLGGESQRVARLLDRMQNVKQPRMTAALQLADTVSQHLGNCFLPARFVQLVGRPLIK